MSSSFQSCSDLYSYDWHGNFTGVTSVIDLTGDDDPLPKPRRQRRIKKEPVDESSGNDLNTTADCTFGSASTSSKSHQTKKTGGELLEGVSAPRPTVKKEKKKEKISRKLYCEDLEKVGGSESKAVDLHGQQIELQRKNDSTHANVESSGGEVEEGVREHASHRSRKKNKGRYLSDEEGRHGQHPVKRHTHQTRGKGKKRAMRTLISDDSEVELEHQTTHQGQRSPARKQRTAASSSTVVETNAKPHLKSRLHPEAEPHHRGQKISESSLLDMSDVAPSGRSVREGGRRTHYHVRTLSSGGGDEILTNIDERSSELSDKDLHRLAQ